MRSFGSRRHPNQYTLQSATRSESKSKGDHNTHTTHKQIQSTKLNSLEHYKQEVINKIQVKWIVIDKEGKISSVKIDEKAPAINKQIILMTLQQVKIPKLTNQILNEMNTEKLDFNMAFEN